MCRRPSLLRRLAFLSLSAVLALASGCGGGGGDSHGPSITGSSLCDLGSQKSWLRAYMGDWYFWSGRSPDPDPQGYATLADYFQSLLYTGEGFVPADRWSFIEDEALFRQFFSDGQTLGYGVSVNGQEGVLPLKVRHVEPLSPAGTAGIVRGDTIVSANGRTAADLVAAADYTAFSSSATGQALTLVIDHAGTRRTVALTSAVFNLTPVTGVSVFDLPNGKKAGYLALKDFVGQAEAPLAAALDGFRAQNATELILDLRYNGGGLVSTSARLASLVTGNAHGQEVYAQLRYNARHTGANTTYRLDSTSGLPYTRVVVLTGPRTCSASELVVNGLKPYVDVVTVGATTCGKPVGFSPVASCGNVFSAVNFDSVNALGQGGYYAGIAPTCPVADDFSRAQGDAAETLTAAALSYLQDGQCPAVVGRADAGIARAPREGATGPVSRRQGAVEPGERQGMWAD